MQAIIYIRVSTEGQAADGVSLEVQEAKARAWYELNDYPIKAVHIDAGISGKRADNRLALQDALSECTDGDALIVYSLSRKEQEEIDRIFDHIAELANKTPERLQRTQDYLQQRKDHGRNDKRGKTGRFESETES
uniref:Resolvase, N terminal domain n=1 Tax=Candidatus Kentrum sp. TUN TaxID=2126343 RepID=A0A450ZK71_9GAMM|nr:MAG: Resolvase, N terminal domain [Candidatus Kentron sp. TUN]